MTYTHYWKRPDGGLKLMSLDRCENCGRTVQAPNGVGAPESEEPKLQRLGLRRLLDLPPEIAVVDDDGRTGCEACEGRTAHERETEASNRQSLHDALDRRGLGWFRQRFETRR